MNINIYVYMRDSWYEMRSGQESFVLIIFLLNPDSLTICITWDHITVLSQIMYSTRSHFSGGFALYCRQMHIKGHTHKGQGFKDTPTHSFNEWLWQRVMMASCNLERSPLKTEKQSTSHSADRQPALTLMPFDQKVWAVYAALAIGILKVELWTRTLN